MRTDGSGTRALASRNGGTQVTRKLALALLAALVLFAFQLARAQSGSASTGVPCPQTGTEVLTTDQPSYGAGDTVHITGTGFAIGCDVQINVTRPDAVVESGTATTDLTGTFSYDYTLPIWPAIVGDYRADALGLNSALLASTIFTDPSNDFPLRSDLTVGINGGTSSRTLTNAGNGGTTGYGTTTNGDATQNTFSGTGSKTFDFYSPKLTAATALQGGDKGSITAWVRNTGAGTLTYTESAEFFDYNPADGSQTSITSTGASGNQNINAGAADKQVTQTGAGLPAAGYTVPIGHELKVTVTINVTAGASGALLVNGSKGTTGDTIAQLPQNNARTWSFGKYRATTLAVTAVSPTSPYVGQVFSVTVQAQDPDGNPGELTSNTGVALSLASGGGTLGGTASGTILSSAANSAATIGGLTYNRGESISLSATRTSGDSLTAGTSSAISVLWAKFIADGTQNIFGTNNATSVSVPLTETTLNGHTVLILVLDNNGNGASRTITSITGPFSTTPAQININSVPALNNFVTGSQTETLYAWKAVANGGSGNVVVNFAATTTAHTEIVDVVQLAGEDPSNPIAQVTTNSGTSSPATVSLTSASASNHEVALVGVQALNGVVANPSGFFTLDHSPTNDDGNTTMDSAGNNVAQSSANFTFANHPWGTIGLEIGADTTAPTASLSCSPSPGTTNATSLSCSASFSESVTGFSSADVTVGGTSSNWSVGTVSGSGSGPYTFTVSRGSPNSDGSLTLQVAAGAAQDAAGNLSTPSSALNYTIDTTAPTAPMVNIVPAFVNNANKSAVQIDITGEVGTTVTGQVTSSAGGAAVTLSGTIPAGGTLSLTKDLSGLNDGTLTASATLTDAAGNTSSAGTDTATKDVVAPSTTLATIPASPDGSNGWFNQPSVQFTLSASDGTSGVANSFYTVDGGPTQTYSGAVTISTQGDHTVTFWSTDNAGNTETTHTTHIKLDNVNPTITVTHTANGDNGWNTGSPVIVSVSVSDATSGIAAAPSCTVDGNPATVSGTGPYTVSVAGDGTHPVSCSVSDNAGNGNSASDTIKIDTVNPAGTITINGNATYTNSTSVTLNLFATDATSMIVSYRVAESSDCSSATFVTPFTAVSPYSANPTFTLSSGDGSKTVCVQYKDAAGNISSNATDSITLDQTAPSTSTALTPPTPDGSNGWYVSTPSFTLSATDATSGVAATFYKLDGGSTQTYTSAVSIPDGQHTVTYWSTDNAGNTESQHTTATIKVDTVNPSTSIAVSPASPDGSNGWYVSTPTFTLSASDATSGVAGTFYKLDGGSTQTYTSAVSIPDGQHTITYWSTDNAGNTESQHTTATIKVDTVKPSISLSHTPDGSGGWNVTSPVTVSVTVSDATSGIAAAPTCSVDGAPSAPASGTSSPYTVTVSGEGAHTVSCSVSDKAGNGKSASDNDVKIDTVNPSTSIAVSPASPDGTNGWYKTTPSFTLSASDATSGVAGTFYKLDGGSTQSYTSAVSIPDGQHTVTYWSTDNAGNTESQHTTATIKVDTVNPSTSIAVSPASPDGSNGWYVSTPSFTLSSSDATSDVASTFYKLDSGATQTYTGSAVSIPDGQHAITYWATDNAGNEETQHTTATIKVDTVNPTIAVSHTANGNHGWNTSSPVTVTVDASDATSGLAGAPSCTDGASSLTLTPAGPGEWTTSVDGDGTHPVSCSVSDNAGNGNSAGDTVKIDTQNPTSNDSNDHAWHNADYTVHLSATDQPTLSGVASITYSVDGGLPTTVSAATASVTVPAPGDHSNDGTHSISYFATDNAGNVESANATIVKIDTGKPNSQITFPVDNTDYNSSTYTAGCGTAAGDICGTSSDPLAGPAASDSGVNLVEVSIKQDATGDYWNGTSFSGSTETWNSTSTTDGYAHWSFNLASPPEGTYTIHSRSTDVAGNVETSFDTATFNEVHVNVDNTAPSSSVGFPANGANLTSANYANGCADGTPDVCGSASDGGTSPSGLDKVDVSIQRASDSQYWNGSGWQAAQAWNLASGTTSWSYGFTPAAGEQYTVQSRATDKATNVESPGAGNTFRVDDLAPTSSDSNDGLWHNADYKVHLSANDLGAFASGVANIEYSLDGGSTQTVGGSSADVMVAAPADHSNDGLHTLVYWATDNAGNAESPHRSTTVKIDTLNPVSSDSNDHAWHNADYTVHLSATDAPAGNAFSQDSSGVASITYTVDGGSPTTVTAASANVTINAPASHLNDGLHTIEYWATDNASNAESHNQTVVTIDTQNPTSSDSNDHAWHNADYTVHLSATDQPGLSGVASLTYTVDNGSPTRVNASTASVTIPAASNDGTHTINYYATDNAGNTETAHSTSVLIDTQNPSSSDDADNAWHKSDVIVHLTATDQPNLSGVASITYAVDGGTPTTVNADHANVTIQALSDHSNDGVHTISYFATDNAGNVESAHPTTVKIDTKTPVTTDNNDGAWHNTPYTVHLSATDAPAGNAFNPNSSGVASITYTVDSGSPTTVNAADADVTVPAPGDNSNDGQHTITYFATDNAGNAETAHSTTVNIDTQQPSSTDNADTAWHSTDVTVHLSATDQAGLSGVANVKYSLNSGPTQTVSGNSADVVVTAPASHAHDGPNTIEYWATDNAGNVESPHHTAAVKIDTQNPISTDNADSAWHKSPVTVHLSATDQAGLSGVASITYSVDGGTPTTVSADNTDVAIAAPADHSNDGVHTISYFATDNAGNAEASHSATVKIDTGQPNSQITFPVNSTDYNASTYAAGCGTAAGDICGTSSDPLAGPAASDSGVSLVEVSVKQDSTGLYWNGTSFSAASETWNSTSTTDGWAHWSFNLASPPEGTYTIHSRATDVAGNVETTFDTATFNEVQVNVDNTAPTSSVSSPANGANLTSSAYANLCADGTPDVCGSAADGGTSASGLAKVEVSIQRASTSEYWNGSGWQASQAWNLASGTTTWSYGFTPAAGDQYTVVSRATDKATNVETPGAGNTFIVDDAAPSSTASSPATSASTTISVSYTANDLGAFASGLDKVEIYAKSPTAGAYSLAHTFTAATGSGSFNYTASDGDGNYLFYSIAYDKAGNSEAAPATADSTTLVDTTGPATSSTTVAPSPTNTAPTLTATETDALSNVAAAEYFVDDASCTNGAGTAMNATDASFDSGTENVTATLAGFGALAQGTHTVYVHGKDALGNWGACQSTTFVKDTATTVAITGWTHPVAAANQASASASGTAEAGDSISLTVSDGTTTLGPFATTATGGNWSFTGLNLSSLNDGTITYAVTASDGLGNSANDSKTATKDTVASVSVTSAADINNANKTTGGAASGSVEAGSTVSVTITDAGNAHSVGPITANVSGTSWSISGVDVSSLNDGMITYTANATDGVGNTAANAKTANKDTVAPAITLAHPANGSTTNNQQPAFDGTAGTATGDGPGVTVKIYSGSSASGSPVATLTTTAGAGGAYSVTPGSALAYGQYTAQAEQTDAAGNLGKSTANTFTISPPLQAVNDSAAVNANSTNYPLDVLANDTIQLGNTISSIQKTGQTPVPGTTTNVTTDQGGTATVVSCLTCSNSNGTQAISYTPATDYVGPDGFDYTITDGSGNYSTAHVSINVTATGSLDSQMILEDSGFNDLNGSFNVLFAKSPKPWDTFAVRLKNTEPGHMHLVTNIYNYTNVNDGPCTATTKDGCTIDNANGNRVTAVLTIPDMPSNCGGTAMRPYTNLNNGTAQDGDCSNPGQKGKPAFSLQGGPDGKDAVHAHPDDKTDEMPVTVQYLDPTGWASNGGTCADKAGTPWSSALPAGGIAKCVKITGLAIKVGHKAKIDVHVDFRPTDTDWPLAANPQLYFRAGFNFKLTKTVTYGLFTPSPTNYSSTDNIDTVGVGKRVTAVGGFAFQGAAAPAPGLPAAGYTVRLFNTPTDANMSVLTPFGTCSGGNPVGWTTADADGFYFIQATGNNDPNNPSTPNLPSGVQYYVQVCDLAGNPVIATLVDHKLADKEFVEWDLNASPAVPRPLSLAIKHNDGKPSNGDTIQVNWTEPLAEVTMCSNWGYDNTKDQTLSGVTLKIVDGGSGNDKLTVVNNSSLCGGGMHFGTIDLGSPNYVATDQSFTSSKIAWSHTGMLTFTLGGSATTTAVTAQITAYYYPDPAMTDTSGNYTPTGVFASDPSSGSTSNF